MRLSHLLLALAAAAPLARAQGDEPPGADLVLRVGRLHDGRGGVLEPAWLIVRGGKVVSASETPPAGADDLPLLDRRHLVATPGLVSASVLLGDGRREEPTLSARFRAVDGFDPYLERSRLLAAGITCAFLHPGRGRLATGDGAVIKTGGDPLGRVLRARAEQCLDLGEAALAPPARVEVPVPSSSDVPILPPEPQRPFGPGGALPELLARIEAALRWEEARESLPAASRPAWDPDLEALAAAVVEGRIRIDARRVEELRAALALAKKLELRPVLAGAAEAGLMAEELALTGLRVVLEMPVAGRGEAPDGRSHPEALRSRLDTAARLRATNVRFALAAPAGAETDLRILAALAIRGGLAPGDALRAITADAAEVLGVQERVGALVAGKDADLVLWSEDPLGARAAAVETWIDGRRVYAAKGADAVVVRAGTVHTMTGEPLRPGEVLIRGGTIAAVGSNVPCPPGARVIDLGREGVVAPGLIDAFGHVGLGGDRGAADASAPLHALVGRDAPDLLAVARAGVTTVALVPWTIPASGARVAAIKTAETRARDARRGMVLAEAAGLAFDLSDMDPLIVSPGFLGRMRAGKAYAARWRQYREALAKWEARSAAGQPASAEERPAPEPEATVKEDPLSGRWTITISGPPLPEPQTGILLLQLGKDGVSVNGLAKTPAAPDEVPVSGSWTGRKLTLVLEAQTPMGQPSVEAELVGPDLLRGTITLGPFKIQLEAVRTEKTAPDIQVRSRSRGRGGRPAPPALDAGLEPWRLCYEQEGVLLLRVGRPAAAATLLELCRKEGLRTVFVGLDSAARLELEPAGSGVVLRPERTFTRPVEGEEVPAALLRSQGARVAFMSEAEDGAAELPLRALLAVSRGLSPADALRALTVDAARLLGLEGRVGTLEPGKDGDLVAWDGPPFDPRSRVRAVVVGGRVVEEEQP